jgi:hypothetical protein
MIPRLFHTPLLPWRIAVPPGLRQEIGGVNAFYTCGQTW